MAQISQMHKRKGNSPIMSHVHLENHTLMITSIWRTPNGQWITTCDCDSNFRFTSFRLSEALDEMQTHVTLNLPKI